MGGQTLAEAETATPLAGPANRGSRIFALDCLNASLFGQHFSGDYFVVVSIFKFCVGPRGCQGVLHEDLFFCAVPIYENFVTDSKGYFKFFVAGCEINFLIIPIRGQNRTSKGPACGSMGSACGVERGRMCFSMFSLSLRCPGLFRADILRDFKPFQADPHAEGCEESNFIKIGRREGLHVVHQGVPHDNIKTLFMWHIYSAYMIRSKEAA